MDFVITARDICPQCSHLWDDHIESVLPTMADLHLACGCCHRMALRVEELNRERPHH